jgi:hypothetical protein
MKITCQVRRLALIGAMRNLLFFTEGGIEFYVFSDGQFDFNTRSSAEINL